MKVRWVRTALADIEAIQDHIARDDPRRAFEIAWTIKTRVEALTDFPDLGRSGRVVGTREFVLADLPWIVVYRLRPPRIEVLRIIHGHRLWPPRT